MSMFLDILESFNFASFTLTTSKTSKFLYPCVSDPFSGKTARSSGTTRKSPALWTLCHVIISFAFAMMIS